MTTTQEDLMTDALRPTDAAPPTYRFWGKAKPKARTITNKAAAAIAGTTATIRLYAPIDSWGGYWGVSAKEFAEVVDELPEDVTEIRLHINSPGGEVFEGLAILNILRNHPAKTVAVVDGIAASAASFVAVGCDETVMGRNSEMMIHDASGFAFGNASTMQKMADILDHLSDNIANVYAGAANGTKAEWRAAMAEENWYSDEEAVAAGLAQRIAGEQDTEDAPDPADLVEADDEPPVLDAVFDLSIFNYAGRAQAPTPKFPTAAKRSPKPPTASAVGTSTTQEGSPAVAFSDEQVTTMRQKLGIAEDADEATILAALDEALAERVEPPADAVQVPEGHVVIPEARLKDLEAGAALAVSTAAKLHTEERDRFLDENRTKYVPASRAAWEKEYDRDPVAVRAHFATAPVIVPVEALGHDGLPETDEDDATYAALFGDEKIGA